MTTFTDQAERVGDPATVREPGVPASVVPPSLRTRVAGYDVSYPTGWQTGQAVSAVGTAIKSDVSTAKHRARVYVLTQPWKAVGIAAGVGFALGLCWNRRS